LVSTTEGDSGTATKLEADLDGRMREEGFGLVGGESVLELAVTGRGTPLLGGITETELSTRRPSMVTLVEKS
jgi:hypothetical protein